MTDMALDLVSHDLVFVQGDQGAGIGLVVLGPATVQKVKITLMGFFAEWFKDPTWGTPWFENILVRNPDLALITSIIRRQILSVQAVKRIMTLDLDFVPETRVLYITTTMETPAGVLTLSMNLVPGRPI